MKIEFKPDYVVEPASILKDYMEYCELSPELLCQRTGFNTSVIQDILSCKKRITPKGLLFPVEIEDYYNGACSLVPGFVNITSAIGICRVLNNITERR
jgi:hypothetical protein